MIQDNPFGSYFNQKDANLHQFSQTWKSKIDFALSRTALAELAVKNCFLEIEACNSVADSKVF